MEWTDGSVYSFRDWYVPTDDILEDSRQMCMTRVYVNNHNPRYCMVVENTDKFLKESIHQLQPAQAINKDGNQKRLCTAILSIGSKLEWIKVPCNGRRRDTLNMCKFAKSNFTQYRNLLLQSETTVHVSVVTNEDVFTVLYENASYYKHYFLEVHQTDANVTLAYRNMHSCPSNSVFIERYCYDVKKYKKNTSTPLVPDNMLEHKQENFHLTNFTLKILSIYMNIWESSTSVIMYVVNGYGKCVMLKYSKSLIDRIQVDIVTPETLCDWSNATWVLHRRHSTLLSMECGYGTYQCEDGTCINVDYQCDGHMDCLTGEDEKSCPAMCFSNTSNITFPSCLQDCIEPDCQCNTMYFKCMKGGCISYHLVCLEKQIANTTQLKVRYCHGKTSKRNLSTVCIMKHFTSLFE